jgi:hypothetical protein
MEKIVADSPTAEDNAELRDRLAAKQEQLLELKNGSADEAVRQSLEYENLQLQAEEARVDSQIKAALEAAKPENVSASNQSNLDAVKADLARALGQPVPEAEVPAAEVTEQKPFSAFSPAAAETTEDVK